MNFFDINFKWYNYRVSGKACSFNTLSTNYECTRGRLRDPTLLLLFPTAKRKAGFSRIVSYQYTRSGSTVWRRPFTGRTTSILVVRPVNVDLHIRDALRVFSW